MPVALSVRFDSLDAAMDATSTITKEEMAALVLEILALSEVPSARRVSLPAEKDQFPKLLALDMNAWIYLAQAAHGHAKQVGAGEALRAVQSGVESGRLVVPIMPMNLTEVGDVKDDARRERLATFMVNMSKNHSVAYSGTIQDREVYDSVRALYLGDHRPSDLRTLVLCWGIVPAVGIGAVSIDWKDGVERPEMQRFLNEALSHPRLSVRTLSRMYSDEGTAVAREVDELCARLLACSRVPFAGATVDQRWVAETRGLVQQGVVRERIERVAAFCNVGLEPLLSWLDDDANRTQFFEAVPQLNTQGKLMLTRDRNLQDLPDRNDMKDLFFMSVALPYANVVVAEKAWAHVAKASRLDALYSTRLVSLAELPKELERQGCV
jgi:hypothetical protein